MASKFKRSGVWYVRYKDTDNEWKNMSCGKGVTAAEADRILHEKESISINNLHKMPLKIIDTTLLDQLIKFRDYEIKKSNEHGRKAKGTIRRYTQCINNFIRYVGIQGWQKFDEINQLRMKDFFDFLEVELEQINSSLSLTRGVLTAFFDWSKTNNWLMENPMDLIKNPRINKKLPRFFSEEELERIFNKAKEPYLNIFRFLYLTGLRIGELGNVEWGHYSSSRLVLRIPVIEGNKTKHEEEIPLSKDAIEIIADQRRNIMKQKTPDAQRYIFLNSYGSKLDNANIYRNLKTTLKDSEIYDGSPHTFRHTFASHLVIRGASLKAVQELCRHKDIKDTLVYAHLSDQARRDSAELLSAPKPSVNVSEFKPKGISSIAG